MRIGIFGGTFNPPHLGHMLLAVEAMEKAELDKLVFMPCANPPHKTGLDIPTGEHRFNMVKLAVGENSDFFVSDMEIDAGGKSYTAKTLERLAEKFPSDRLCFIVGADSLCEMESWFCPQEIFKRAEIVVALRGGMKENELNMAIDFFTQKYSADIRKIDMKVIEMSSTDIRERIETGKSVKYMLCDDVIDYINANGIYKGKTEAYAEN